MTKINGPIELKKEDTQRESIDSSSRKHSCKNYSTCLNLAASLDWNGFNCTKCSGNINEQLIWRAQSAQKKDSLTKKLFPLPKIKCITTKTNIKVKKVS